MNYRKYVLENGLRVLLAPVKESETVTVLVMAGTGSRYEDKLNNGISHFLEHMFFKGTKKRPNALAITEELDSIGGEYNAFTSKDRTGYWAKVGAKHAGTALDVISDIFLHSKLDAKELEKERGAILQELNMYEDTPVRHIGDMFESLLYGDQPLGWEIIGTKENIRTMKRDAFVKYYDSHYKANNVVVAVAGKINQKEMLERIRKTFSEMSQAETPKRVPVREEQAQASVLFQDKKTDQTHMILGARAYHMFHKDRYALSLLATILGGNMSSRLFMEVREKRGLAYTVRTSVDTYHDAGYLATQCGVEHANLKKTIEVVMAEYRKISRALVPPKELCKAKEYINGRLSLGLETSDEMASYLADQELLRGEIVMPDVLMKRIEKVTASDVRRVAKDIFRPERMNLTVIGPHSDSAEYKKLLSPRKR